MDLSVMVLLLSWPVEGGHVSWELWIFEFTIGIKLVLESWCVNRKLVVSPDSVPVGQALLIGLVCVGPEFIDKWDSVVLGNKL